MNHCSNAEASSSKRTLEHFVETRGRPNKKKRITNHLMESTDCGFYAELRGGAISSIRARPRREAAKEGQERRRLSICALRSRSCSQSGSRPGSEDEDEADEEIWQKISVNEAHRLGVEGFVWEPTDPVVARNIQTNNVWMAEKRPMQDVTTIDILQQIPKTLPSYLLRTPLVKTMLDKVPKVLPFTDVALTNEVPMTETQEKDMSDAGSDDTEDLIETIKNLFTKKTMDAADHIIKHEQDRINPLSLPFLSMPAFGSSEEAPEATSNLIEANSANSLEPIDLTGDDDDDFEITSVVRLAPDSQMGRAFAKREGFELMAGLQEEMGLSEEDFYAAYNEVKKEYASRTGSESKESSEQPSSSQSSVTSFATTPEQEDEAAIEAMTTKMNSPTLVGEETSTSSQVQDFVTNSQHEECHSLHVVASQHTESGQSVNALLEGEEQLTHKDSSMDMYANDDSFQTCEEHFAAEDGIIDGSGSRVQVDRAEIPLQDTATEEQEVMQTIEKCTVNETPEDEIMDLSMSPSDTSRENTMADDVDENQADDREKFVLPFRRKRSSSVLVNRFREQDDAEEAERRVQAEAERVQASIRQQSPEILENQALYLPNPIAPDISLDLESLQLNKEEEEDDSDDGYSDTIEKDVHKIRQSASSSNQIGQDQQNDSAPARQVPSSEAAAPALPLVPAPSIPTLISLATSVTLPARAQTSLPNTPVKSSFAQPSQRVVQSHSPSVESPVAPLYVRGFRGLPQRRKGFDSNNN